MQQIASIIQAELDHPCGATFAENLRAAAWYVMEDFPSTTGAQFAEAAASLGLHRQGARNRWNEARKNWEIANG